MGKYERKAMVPTKKVISTVENSEDHSIQEQMVNMMVKMMMMVEASAQQAAEVDRALEETRAELTTRITELQQENQFLKETQRKMQYDHYNLEIEENKEKEEQPKQKTLVARPMEIPHPVEGVARSEHCTLKSNDVKLDDLEDWKQQIMAKMTKKIGGYNRFTNPLDLVVMATRGVSRSQFIEWIVKELKPKDFVVLTFKSFDEKSYPVNHIFNFQHKMALEMRNEAILCKVFSTMLIGPALTWFKQLPKKSVDSFEELCTQFIKQYNSNRQQQKTMADLYRLVQNEDETPQQYLAGFVEVMNTIYDADSVVAAGSFIMGLQLGSMLFKDLVKNTPYDMAEIRARAEGVFRVLESIEKLSKKVIAISMEKAALEYNKSSFLQNNQGWKKRQRNDRAGGYRQPMQSPKSEVPILSLMPL